jgi:hypothetical protein
LSFGTARIGFWACSGDAPPRPSRVPSSGHQRWGNRHAAVDLVTDDPDLTARTPSRDRIWVVDLRSSEHDLIIVIFNLDR